MVNVRPAAVLHGRSDERRLLDQLLDAVRDGQSRVLVLTGEPGVGKTSLLESLVESAAGFRVAGAVGVESEMELAFAAAHQLCAPMLDRLERLPAPQRDAIGVAFGLQAGARPARFLVGLALLGMLSEAAQQQPLLCVVDDAQWLDRASEQALAFVARRLSAESVGLVFATRDVQQELERLPRLALQGLSAGDARKLLDEALRVPLDEGVQERLIAETGGNPLALLELPRTLTPGELSGGFWRPDAPRLSVPIEDSFRRRMAALPPPTRQLLLVAAAEPAGDLALISNAAQQLGTSIDAAAETDGLLTIGTRVTFRHPLVRSSVYEAASEKDRRAVHRALAEATDPAVDPDRRAWHLASATQGFDEDVASELERSAGRAQARGGVSAAAAFLQRAAALTPESPGRTRRTLAAVQAMYEAGALEAALALLATAYAGALDEHERARAELLRGQIAFAMSHGTDVPPMLLAAARRFATLDVRVARETYLEALTAVLFAGRLATHESVLDTARAASEAPPAPGSPQACDLVLDGLARLMTEGYEAGVPTLKRALSAFRAEDPPEEQRHRWLWLACRTAALLWDNEAWDALSARAVGLARETGALAALPLGLTHRAGALLFAGELGLVAEVVEEVAVVNEATGTSLAPYVALALAAFQGREAEASRLIEAATTEVLLRGEGQGLTIIDWSKAVLNNGLGRYETALAAAQQGGEDSSASWFRNWGLVELVEAGARTGRNDVASDALSRLAETTAASGTDWALGVEARARALLSADAEAERLYREAIERLTRSRLRLELARARLLYGEWLRRERRRLDAREQLRSAHDFFSRLGMEAFAERARVELAATGERARKRIPETIDELTPQEAQICRLAAEGTKNQDIAARLFISPRTVDYHLRKAFRKLGVQSRHQLKEHLPEPAGPAHSANDPS